MGDSTPATGTRKYRHGPHGVATARFSASYEASVCKARSGSAWASRSRRAAYWALASRLALSAVKRPAASAVWASSWPSRAVWSSGPGWCRRPMSRSGPGGFEPLAAGRQVTGERLRTRRSGRVVPDLGVGGLLLGVGLGPGSGLRVARRPTASRAIGSGHHRRGQHPPDRRQVRHQAWQAQPGPQPWRRVCGPLRDRRVRPSPGQHRAHGDGQDRDQRVPAPPRVPRTWYAPERLQQILRGGARNGHLASAEQAKLATGQHGRRSRPPASTAGEDGMAGTAPGEDHEAGRTS